LGIYRFIVFLYST